MNNILVLDSITGHEYIIIP